MRVRWDLREVIQPNACNITKLRAVEGVVRTTEQVNLGAKTRLSPRLLMLSP